ncbi:hypothetical protein RDI58_001887 [Solanum bulbocastanum]|uniref:Uncharacterized protein n=1 Tax=Solanum bulbocastanum TaxID=147425 RepID=A0AAN8YNI7_SOLBU
MFADKPTQAISDDIPEFEDFSSKPPDQIVRRSRHGSAGPSSDPKEKKDFSKIEGVKKYMTEY